VALIAGGVVVLRLEVICHTIVVVERIALLVVVGVVCGKLVGLPYSHHSLYRNNGDGTFTDVSNEAGISKVAPGYGLTVVAADLTRTAGRISYVTCDTSASLLFRNRHDGTFEEVGLGKRMCGLPVRSSR